jgi:pimeloyl-ACP methyl ester carboxylesterase
MDFVTSADGTRIAYERAGSGHPIVFASGAFNDHHTCAPLAERLAGDFTVVTYDRRARGASGDTRPYAMEREVDDLAALIETVGGAAAVFGFSSGALLAVYAAALKAPITGLALYEAPFAVDSWPDRADRYQPSLPARLDDLVRQGRGGDAVALFQSEGIGLPAEMVAWIRTSPMFPALEAIAQSTVYDATITAAYAVPDPALTAVQVPSLVMNGAATWPGLAQAARALAAALPEGRYQEIPGGADHGLPADETAIAVRSFLSSFLDG